LPRSLILGDSRRTVRIPASCQILAIKRWFLELEEIRQGIVHSLTGELLEAAHVMNVEIEAGVSQRAATLTLLQNGVVSVLHVDLEHCR